MFGFLEFLRVVSVGLVSLLLVSIALWKDLLRLELGWLLLIATLLGLLIQPFLRAYHPYRRQIHDVIRHVENYVSEALGQDPDQSRAHSRVEREPALARAIYEHCIRTADPQLLQRVNEQIRFFYFYYFLSVAFRIAFFLLVGSAVLKALMSQDRIAKLWPAWGLWAKTQCLMGLSSMWALSMIIGFYVVFVLFLSRRFAGTAKGIILSELDARLVFLLTRKKEIQLIAKQAANDPSLSHLLGRKIDKETGRTE